MTASPTALPLESISPAVAYRRAHTGKLMIIQRKDGTDLNSADFFRLESVGTHPTGLLVRGIFENERRGDMMATAVRDANESEIAWRDNLAAQAPVRSL